MRVPCDAHIPCVSSDFKRVDSHGFAGPRDGRAAQSPRLTNASDRPKRELRGSKSRTWSKNFVFGRARGFPCAQAICKVPTDAPIAGDVSRADYGFYQQLKPEEIDVYFLWTERLEPKLDYLNSADRRRVQSGLMVAFAAHDGQLRKSGEPFISHPVEVTRILAELRLDTDTLIAGLLHDTVEDTEFLTFEEIERQFGQAVRKIVEGETRFSKVSPTDSLDAEDLEDDPKALDFRHFFTSMTEDVRIIVVKLADRLHNMRTMDSMKPHKREKKAKETLDVFAPLASMLGLESIKDELEELSLKYLDPSRYAEIMEFLARKMEKAGGFTSLQGVRQALLNHLAKDVFLGSEVEELVVNVRRKPVYGLYKKVCATRWVLKNNPHMNQVHYLQILVNLKDGSSLDRGVCYYILGAVHKLWTPIPQTFKDYIASPKAGCRKGLHTTVWPLGGSRLEAPLEVHIESMDMYSRTVADFSSKIDAFVNKGTGINGNGAGSNENGNGNGNGVSDVESFALGQSSLDVDESWELSLLENGSNGSNGNGNGSNGNGNGSLGPALHVNGASSGPLSDALSNGGVDGTDGGFGKAKNWLQRLKVWQTEVGMKMSARDFVECVTEDFLVQSVYVLTPMGEVVQLPKGAVVLDFAYHIHTDVGNRMIRAKVDGREVSPNYRLKNAEVVEIFVREGPPDTAFLQMLRSKLSIVRTKSAKRKLKLFIRRNEEMLKEQPEHDVLTTMEEKAAESTLWLELECQDTPGILADVSRAITGHNLSITKYWGHPRGEGFVMRYDLGPAKFCVEALCAELSEMPGITGWSAGCTLASPGKQHYW